MRQCHFEHPGLCLAAARAILQQLVPNGMAMLSAKGGEEGGMSERGEKRESEREREREGRGGEWD